MAEPFLGEIRLFSFSTLPRGWAVCNGQLLSIQQNQALYSIIGTQYGGNGQTTFALPDLRGRVPLASATTYPVGRMAGEAQHALTLNEIPTHTHQVVGSADLPTKTVATGNVWASGPTAYIDSANSSLNVNAVAASGGSQPHSNMQPYLVVAFCMATAGLYPSRD